MSTDPLQTPRPTNHPYPHQYVGTFRLRDGREVVVRPIVPEDEPLIVAMHASHSEHTLRMRFFSLVKTLSRESLSHLCNLDYDRDMALVAVAEEGGQRHALGVSRYYLQLETGIAEFALVVRHAYRRQGLGRHLLQRLIDRARERGVRKLTGEVLAENGPMLQLTTGMGFRAVASEDPSVVEVSLDLGK
jgi:acetyltransferase